MPPTAADDAERSPALARLAWAMGALGLLILAGTAMLVFLNRSAIHSIDQADPDEVILPIGFVVILVIGWLLLRQAEIALSKLTAGARDESFYAGKVAAARFFAATRLPLLAAERAVAEATDLDLMDLDEAAF